MLSGKGVVFLRAVLTGCCRGPSAIREEWGVDGEETRRREPTCRGVRWQCGAVDDESEWTSGREGFGEGEAFRVSGKRETLSAMKNGRAIWVDPAEVGGGCNEEKQW